MTQYLEEDYHIAFMQEAIETWYSKPCEGQHVSEGKTTSKRILENESNELVGDLEN
jgi:hypothetical protein